jgi:metal-responsive CopG/Arc/MetJ family transcriptional regulator
MRHFSFRIFEESDPDVIAWLDSLPKMERSAMIRRALRAYIHKPDFVIRKRRNSKVVNE